MYAAGLSTDHFQRYMDKITIIQNKDPYLLKMDNTQLPTTVTYESIIDYALKKQSAYTGSSFRCFKAVDAKLRFENGMVKSVEGVLFGDIHVVRANVCMLLNSIITRVIIINIYFRR